jgi:hypothetical protein
MQKLIELYEMVAMNDVALCDSERRAILEARSALGMFERAMESFRSASAGAPAAAESCFPIAA